MLNIGIMTWLHNSNYGTVLQAYALQSYLRSCGYNITNIDFNATAPEKVKNLIYCGNSLGLFLEKFEMARTKKAADSAMHKIKEERFQRFITDNFHLTEKITSYDQLADYSCSFDTYICGSDQIWSPNLLNPPYYLSFVDKDKKKIAYACSFGVSSIPGKKKQKIQIYLGRFSHISVREQEGKNIVKDLLGIEVCTTVDPVFLLDHCEWDSIASGRDVKDHYAFAYFLTYNEDYIRIAKQAAKQLGIQLVLVPAVREEYRVDAELVQNAGPAEWISLIKHADVVLTDSFHGCVFSLIYEKPLMIFRRFKDTSKNSQNSRIYTLVKQYGLKDNVVESFDTAQLEKIMQYKSNIRERIDKNAEFSKNWLNCALRK
ncbi:MAG: polysaccharide pyruvyl transferase family protein [Oscillospiraceae bacterium]|nr:polysaccharide pyruvyl transferase family protein [Oscillospiraceae bacterium]